MPAPSTPMSRRSFIAPILLIQNNSVHLQLTCTDFFPASVGIYNLPILRSQALRLKLKQLGKMVHQIASMADWEAKVAETKAGKAVRLTSSTFAAILYGSFTRSALTLALPHRR